MAGFSGATITLQEALGSDDHTGGAAPGSVTNVATVFRITASANRYTFTPASVIRSFDKQHNSIDFTVIISM
jgi:hypothetical protein